MIESLPIRQKKDQVEFHGHLHFLALATFHEARRCFYLAEPTMMMLGNIIRLSMVFFVDSILVL